MNKYGTSAFVNANISIKLKEDELPEDAYKRLISVIERIKKEMDVQIIYDENEITRC